MSWLEFTLRGRGQDGRREDEEPRGKTRRERLLEVFALLVAAAVATDYSRGRRAGGPEAGEAEAGVAQVEGIDDFGEQQVGTPGAPRIVAVRNIGGGELRIAEVAVLAEGAPAFFLPADECSHASLAPGSACQVAVAFAPPAPGPHRATLTIADDGARSPHRLALTGTGIGEVEHPPEPHAEARLEPAELQFRAEVRGRDARTVSVLNTGDAPLALREISFSGDRGDFTVDQTGCAGGPIPPGEGCSLAVWFEPQAPGAQAALLAIAHDAHDSPLLLPLRGEAMGPPQGFCCLDGKVVPLDEGACAERQGDFSLDPAELERRCAPRDTTPPPTPGRLRPGSVNAEAPQFVACAPPLPLEWGAVRDESMPVQYLLTLENGRGTANTEHPTSWASVHDRVPVEPGFDAAGWVAEVLAPPGEGRRVVRPPLAAAARVPPPESAEREAAARERAAREPAMREPAARVRPELLGRLAEGLLQPATVAFPEFRWRVSARDAAGIESAPSPWLYLRCRNVIE